MIQKMVENGLLAEINFENVPNIVNIDPVYLEKSKAFDPENRYSVPYTGERSGISTMSRSWKSLESRHRRSGRISGMKD